MGRKELTESDLTSESSEDSDVSLVEDSSDFTDEESEQVSSS